MLDEEKLQRAKLSHDTELQHAYKLKELTGNPQGRSDDNDFTPPNHRARDHFGSYVDVAKGNLTQTSELTIESMEKDDVQTVISKLTNAYNELKNSMTTSISSTVETIVDQKIEPFAKQVKEIQEDSTEKYNELITMHNNHKTTTDAKLDKILILLGGDKKAPSDATRSPGVGQ